MTVKGRSGMGNRKVSVSRLDPTKKATAEEVALVIEQGARYLEFLTNQRKKLYNTCASLDDFIEANALQGISYEKFSYANNSLSPDSISRILESSEKQLRDSQEEYKEYLFLLTQEEEKYLKIYRAYTTLPLDDSKLLESFYVERKEAHEIIEDVFKGQIKLRAFWKRKSKALELVAERCHYTPYEGDWDTLKHLMEVI